MVILQTTDIQIPFIYFELAPVIYLLILSYLDCQYGLVMRTHFLPIISEIRGKIGQYRVDHPTGSCLVASTSCPITMSLEDHHVAMQSGQLESIAGDIWATIRKGFRLQNQASFFEIVTIQLFVLYLASSYPIILIAAIGMFALPYVGSTYIAKELVAFFKPGYYQIHGRNVISNEKMRILFVFILLVISYFILSGIS